MLQSEKIYSEYEYYQASLDTAAIDNVFSSSFLSDIVIPNSIRDEINLTVSGFTEVENQNPSNPSVIRYGS